MDSVKKVLNNKVIAWALSCFMFLGFTACLDDADSSMPNTPVAYVSLFNASPDAPQLDIEVDDNQINSGPFEYAEYVPYLRFYTGVRNLKFGPYASSSINIDTTITFEPNNAYSVFVVNEFANGEVVVLRDTADAPASGKANVRIINLSPDAGNVDFTVADATENWASDLDFKEASNFTEVAAGEFDFQVRASDDDEVLLSLPNTRFKSGYYYTVIIRGYDTPPDGNTHVLAAQIVVN